MMHRMLSWPAGLKSLLLCGALLGFSALGGGGCSPAENTVRTDAARIDVLGFPGSLAEPAPPEQKWRGHQLKDCPEDREAPARVERLLGLSAEFFQEGSGSDGMIELELAREAGVRDGLLDLVLGQLYLLAGQGEPSLLPTEGPAADVGNWDRNKKRLLARAEQLLQSAANARPHDAACDFLLADVARAQGDPATADHFAELAQGKCTEGRGMSILRQYQQLNRYPAKYLGGAAPEFPAEALARGASGEVVIDLLLDPGARIRQAEEVSSPDADLTRAAFLALQEGQFEAARVGKYPVWSWLRVTIAFNLEP